MSTCRKFKKDLVAYLSGNLKSSQSQQLEQHLKECPACRKELSEFRKVFNLSSEFKSELQEVMESIDWEQLSLDITEKVWERSEEQQKRTSGGWLYRWRWSSLTAGLIFGLLLGSLFTYIMTRTSRPNFPTARQAAAESKIRVPADLVEKVDLALARRETIDYLDRSQYLILDLLQSKGTEGALTVITGDKIQQLLAEKKYLNPQLDDISLLKARAICDQIELLFLELSQLSPEASGKELLKLRELVEKNQLLLKINLVKKELQQSEV
ncbi:MAG: anti-sigma factor family protein [Candidatus Saccharicenans sp.]|nr:MAG: hypothetical protein C0168_07615 [Candidatus Aminicenantes bacterium]HEK84743.1 hypothetical protein [Candidatus Aminicenantes bacterium]